VNRNSFASLQRSFSTSALLCLLERAYVESGSLEQVTWQVVKLSLHCTICRGIRGGEDVQIVDVHLSNLPSASSRTPTRQFDSLRGTICRITRQFGYSRVTICREKWLLKLDKLYRSNSYRVATARTPHSRLAHSPSRLTTVDLYYITDLQFTWFSTFLSNLKQRQSLPPQVSLPILPSRGL